MNQYARSAHFNEYMRKEQFDYSIGYYIYPISMTDYRSFLPVREQSQFVNMGRTNTD